MFSLATVSGYHHAVHDRQLRASSRLFQLLALLGSDCSDLPMASLLLVVQDTDWPQVNVIIGVRFKGTDSSVYTHGTPRPFEERMPSRIDPLGSCD